MILSRVTQHVPSDRRSPVQKPHQQERKIIIILLCVVLFVRLFRKVSTGIISIVCPREPGQLLVQRALYDEIQTLP